MSRRPRQPINVKPTVGQRLDRAIGVFAPKWEARRAMARAAVQGLGSYRGASNSRLRSEWMPLGGSADADVLADLPRLRERSRDLVRNDGTAAGNVKALVNHTVGVGIRPQSKIDFKAIGLDEDQAREFQKAADRVFKRWAPYADVRRELSVFRLQRLAFRSAVENGEVLIVPRRLPRRSPDGFRRPYTLALQLIEADRLETPPGMAGGVNPATGRKVRGGIERDEDGAPVVYWIRDAHPGELGSGFSTSRKWTPLEAIDRKTGFRKVIHVFDPERVGQSRGVPCFAPVLDDYRDHQEYMEAERVAARVAACFGLIIETDSGYGSAVANSTGTGGDGERLESIEPGLVHYSNKGEKHTQINPLRPGTMFGEFVTRILRSISGAIGIPYELANMDYSGVNFSSARAARIDARPTFEVGQMMVSEAFQAVWEMLLEEAFTLEELPEFVDQIFAQNRHDLTRAVWIGPGQGYVRPDQEIAASAKAIELGTSTLQAESAANGTDWEENLEQRALEQRRAKELGLSSSAPHVIDEEKEDPDADDGGEELPGEGSKVAA